MAHRVPITVRLDSFEGPLDLLLYLIQSHELDINKVSISRITDQYLAYVRLMQELNFDTASEFLVMAATLLHWKSKALLPQEATAAGAQAADDVMTQEELIRQLMEHQRFLAAGQRLSELPQLGADVFTRPNRRPPSEKVWKEMDITALALGFQDLLVRATRRTKVLRKETVSLSDKIGDFRRTLRVGKLTELASLIQDTSSRPEVVVTFLATLELSRLRKMRLFQDETYAPIFIELLESLENFNGDLSSSFDYGTPPAAGLAAGAAAPAPGGADAPAHAGAGTDAGTGTRAGSDAGAPAPGARRTRGARAGTRAPAGSGAASTGTDGGADTGAGTPAGGNDGLLGSIAHAFAGTAVGSGTDAPESAS